MHNERLFHILGAITENKWVNDDIFGWTVSLKHKPWALVITADFYMSELIMFIDDL